MVKISNINTLNILRSDLSKESKAIGDIAINLYKERKIEQFRTVEKLLIDLKRKNNIKAISKINDLVKSIKPTRSETIKEETEKMYTKKRYFIKGKINVQTTYTEDKKQRSYDSEGMPYLKSVYARNEKEAKKICFELLEEEFNSNEGADDEYWCTHRITDEQAMHIFDDDASSSALSPAHTYMKAGKPLAYDFIMSDNALEKNEGFCTIDNFVDNCAPTQDLLKV